MSTFLQMVNTVRTEAGIGSGTDLVTLQNGLSAESTRIKNWVNREWQRVQALKADWQWMRQSFLCPMTPSVANYSLATIGAASTPQFTAAQFGNWKRDSFRIYSDPAFADEMLTAFMPWDTFRNVYQYGSMRAQTTRPVAFSIGPDKSLWFGITPDATGWKFDGEMYLAPSALSADNDVPGMPARFHDLVVYRALKAYAVFMNAGEVLQRANDQIAEIQPQMIHDQLPLMTVGPPLA